MAAPASADHAEIARAFNHLYQEWAQQIALWARRLGGPGIDAEDVVQEVFVVLHRRLPNLTESDRLAAWLFQLTENMVRHQRRARRWASLFGGAEAHADPAPHPSVPELLERREAELRLYRCLHKLKDRYRVPLILFELEGRPCEEIAGLLGLTLPTVWTRVRRGREQLLARLTKLEIEEQRRANRLEGSLE